MAHESLDDVCSLTLARRMAAWLDLDPFQLDDGQPLPRGWHTMLFNPPTPQSKLREDGAAGLGVQLPDIGLPRLMLGGRQNVFKGDLPIGARVRRESRSGAVQMKTGRSGRFALVSVEHRIFVGVSAEPVVIEAQDYVLREASTSQPANVQPPPPVSSAASIGRPAPDLARTILVDEPMLFRYSAITDNPHRIHYDYPYTTRVEGYPALVVNGSIPAMFLLQMFRELTGREPATFNSRNLAPMFCNRPLRLNVLRELEYWRLWASDENGQITFEAKAS